MTISPKLSLWYGSVVKLTFRGVGEILQSKAYKISLPTSIPFPAAGLFRHTGCKAFFPSVVLDLSAVPILGPESDGSLECTFLFFTVSSSPDKQK